ncbi:ROK family protein [Saccharibacillus brassicae]|uniref:ROK family protein n=1 Tax=Saccharibacillus brassicae TaxID=2583377 RepID=A0A4Y6UUZ6_SACBS|nr:ROK family protein [Saccharibacillus brassicae]QDH19825.1 ROK family protein [Saccharibacillus brassicae]
MQPAAHSSIKVKKMNEEAVRQALRNAGSGTKTQIAQITGLSIATCGTLLGEMLESGEALEDEPEQSSGGRRARRYVYNADHTHAACICAMYEKEKPTLLYAVADSFGRILERRAEEVDALDEAAIDTLIGALLSRYAQIKAVGIGIPGLVHEGVINICDAAELIGVPLGQRIEQKYGVKVTVENDMNLTVYGLYGQQPWAEPETAAAMIFVPGCFPGAGLMIDGRIHRGASRFAGEVSFLPFGMSRDEQFERLNVKETFVPLAAHAVASLAAIVNPRLIALMGDQVDAADMPAIRELCLTVIPAEHMPELTFVKTPEEPYMQGLIAMTLESLSYSFKLVENKH